MKLLFQIGLVALGSAVGGTLRWGVGVAASRLWGATLPYGTFIINMSGCLFLGWFVTLVGEKLALSERAWLAQDDLRLLVAVGFTGAYTTFSTFELETSRLFGDGESVAGWLYVLLSVAIGLAAIRLGVARGAAWLRAFPRTSAGPRPTLSHGGRASCRIGSQ